MVRVPGYRFTGTGTRWRKRGILYYFKGRMHCFHTLTIRATCICEWVKYHINSGGSSRSLDDWFMWRAYAVECGGVEGDLRTSQ